MTKRQVHPNPLPTTQAPERAGCEPRPSRSRPEAAGPAPSPPTQSLRPCPPRPATGDVLRPAAANCPSCNRFPSQPAAALRTRAGTRPGRNSSGSPPSLSPGPIPSLTPHFQGGCLPRSPSETRHPTPCPNLELDSYTGAPSGGNCSPLSWAGPAGGLVPGRRERSLVGCSPWGREETSLSRIGEGNGSPPFPSYWKATAMVSRY